MIYVALTFHPNQKNPARASGFGTYRVADCWREPDDAATRIFFGHRKAIVYADGMLVLQAPRAYQHGSRVDPLKIALAARHGNAS